MIINLIVGIIAVAFVSQNFGSSLFESIDITTAIFFFIGNLMFMISTGVRKAYLELFKITFLKSKTTDISLKEAQKLNLYLILLNILLGFIIYLLSKLTIFNHIQDPSLIAPLTAYSLHGIIIPLIIIAFVLLPQRLLISNHDILKND